MTSTASKKQLASIADQVDVTRYLSYRDYLGAFYDLLKKQMESYSYLQFAEDLGFSKTNVIRLVIAGKRPLTLKAGEKIAKSFALKGPERKYWLMMVRYNNERVPAQREEYFQKLMDQKQKDLPTELDQKHLEYFNEWYYPVIREMVVLPEFDGTPEWIKGNLSFPLRLEEIKRALELLEELEFLTTNPETGKLKVSDKDVITERELDSISIVRYHQKMIEIGKESITRVDEDMRDIRAMTLRLSPEKVDLVKAKIEVALREVLEMEDEEGEELEEDADEQERAITAFCNSWLDVVGLAVTGRLLERIMRIPSLTQKGCEHLNADLTYLVNVFSALGVSGHPHPLLGHVAELAVLDGDTLSDRISSRNLTHPLDAALAAMEERLAAIRGVAARYNY